MTEITIPNLSTRIEAKEQGLTRYYTGIPCVHGHLTERMVTNKTCLACHRIHIRTRKNKNSPENKVKCKARSAANDEIRRGKITKPDNCSRCNSTVKIEGHHEDYSKPLEIIWLCESCHQEHHKYND